MLFDKCEYTVQFIRLPSERKWLRPVAYPAILFLVWGSGGSCNFVQEISFHIVKSS